jgi:hypothetical protein
VSSVRPPPPDPRQWQRRHAIAGALILTVGAAVMLVGI